MQSRAGSVLFSHACMAGSLIHSTIPLRSLNDNGKLLLCRVDQSHTYK